MDAQEVCYEWVSDPVLQTWPRLPLDWHTIEVLFQLRVGSPGAVAFYGVTLAKNPFHPRLQQTNLAVWIMWCSLHTLHVQDIITE